MLTIKIEVQNTRNAYLLFECFIWKPAITEIYMQTQKENKM